LGDLCGRDYVKYWCANVTRINYNCTRFKHLDSVTHCLLKILL
jgi:hypothetical protein